MDLKLLLILLLQFSTVFMLIWSLFRYPIQPEPPVNRQIAMALGLAGRSTIFDLPFIGQILNMLVLLARRFPFFRDRVRQDLETSGNPNGYSVDEYLAICFGCGLGITAVFMLMLALLGQFSFLFLIFMPAAGFWMGLFALSDQAARRRKTISRKLPYTLDLIALLMEAGASFTEAIQVLIKDEPDDELNKELKLVQAEIDFGTSRAVALHNMARRINLDHLYSVVGAINQAENLGTPLSTILKNQSGMIRMLRSVSAEEASASASLRILIPSMLILLAVVLVVFSPLIMNWLDGRLFAG